MSEWHDTSIITVKSTAPDSIKENIRCGARAYPDGVTVAIRWEEPSHGKLHTITKPGMIELSPKHARELAAALLAAADDAEWRQGSVT